MLLSNLALGNNLFIPDVIIPGVPTAGDNFNITCRLDGVVERLVDPMTVSLTFINNPPGEPENQYRDGSVYIRPQAFNPGKTSYVGTYICLASVIPSSGGFFGGTSSNDLQIRSKCKHMVLYNYMCTFV